MLTITVPAIEEWDEVNECFKSSKAQTLQLEHSLVSISKWEMKWRVPFLSETEKSAEQQIDYVRCMTLTQNVDPSVYRRLSAENFKQISEYISTEMTATTFSKHSRHGNRKQVVTSEVVYYWMVALQIPFECQKWHFSRLITLIRVCEEENKPNKKMSRQQIMQRNAALNAARRKRLNSRG